MKRYSYKVFREDGTAETGVITADTAQEAAARLHEQGCTIAHLQELPRRFRWKALSGRVLSVFCREWSSLLAAGLPLTESLAVIASHGNRAFRETLTEISRTVASGRTLGDAFRRSGAFPPFFLSMITVGERSGTLPEQLARLSVYYEKAAAMRRQWLAALAYPVFILCFACAVFLLLLMVILPSFSLLFDALHLPLPALTRGALSLGLFLRVYGLLLLLVPLTAVLILCIWKRTESGRDRWERFLFRSRFVRRLFFIRFCASLSALLQSGSPLSEALAAAEETAGNGEGQRRIARMREALARGAGLAESLRRAAQAPPLVVHMAAAGAESGELPAFLREAARLLTEETERKLARLKAVLEPALLCAVGGLTATVVFTVMIPVFTAVGRGW